VEELSKRRRYTEEKIIKLRDKLDNQSANLAKGKACVYATGSFGRCEASQYSDLDLFIVGNNIKDEQSEEKEKRLLTRLKEITLKADLIKIAEEMKFPEFSGDGEYLTYHSVSDLTNTLGTPEDDVTNTFTARLLLLLESKWLLEETVYNDVIHSVIRAYWKDFEDHSDEFMPAFLANDIIRLWRTFCVNYEWRTRGKEKEKGQLKNFKLKHSRLMTCYSALIWLLFVYKERKTVTHDDVFKMIKLTPTERLDALKDENSLQNARKIIGDLLNKYESFLQTTHIDEDGLLRRFSDTQQRNKYMDEASTFGNLMFEALESIGKGNLFYRHLVV
jgi:predicted nucleotidyltransferase